MELGKGVGFQISESSGERKGTTEWLGAAGEAPHRKGFSRQWLGFSLGLTIFKACSFPASH